MLAHSRGGGGGVSRGVSRGGVSCRSGPGAGSFSRATSAGLRRSASHSASPSKKRFSSEEGSSSGSTTGNDGVACSAFRAPVAMPIGVPRVPFRTPKEGLWTWVDIWNCLYRERIIFVGQGLTDEFANQLVSTMLFLDSENQKDITLYVNCPGGDVVPTLSIHDAMRHLGSDVGTIAFGGAYAMGGFLLASGTKGKRMALPNTLIMLHSPSGTARGQASDIMNESKELIRVRAYLAERLGDCTGHTMEQTIVDFQRNRYFTPETAMEYGIIDRVVFPNKSYNAQPAATPAAK